MEAEREVGHNYAAISVNRVSAISANLPRIYRPIRSPKDRLVLRDWLEATRN